MGKVCIFALEKSHDPGSHWTLTWYCRAINPSKTKGMAASSFNPFAKRYLHHFIRVVLQMNLTKRITRNCNYWIE